MRFSLILEDEYGNQVNMTKNASGGYMTSEITGLDPPNATVVTSAYATGNLSHYDNSYVPKRNIVIKFEMRGPKVEKRRQELYEVVRPASYIKVYYKTKRRNVYSEGYVETCTISNFSEKVSGQISIVCPDPYWYELESTVITHNFGDAIESTSGFHFEAPNDEQPFTLGKSYDEEYESSKVTSGYADNVAVGIENNGEETGMLLTASWVGALIGTGGTTAGDIKVVNGSEQLTLSGSGSSFLRVGYDLRINTTLGSRSIFRVNPEDESDILNCMKYVQATSQWIQLKHGFNLIEIKGLPFETTGTSGSHVHATITIEYRTRYLGV